MYGKPIPWVRKAKYLRVPLDHHLTFHEHLKEARSRAAFANVFQRVSLSLRYDIARNPPVQAAAKYVPSQVSRIRRPRHTLIFPGDPIILQQESSRETSTLVKHRHKSLIKILY